MRNLAQRMPARLAVLSLFGLLALAGFGLQAAGGFDGVKRASAQTVLPVSVGGPYSGTAGIPITVSGFASGASNPQYSWSFGDGAAGSGQTTSHTYTAGGTFTVTLTVFDLATGRSGSASTTATISGSSSCIPGVNVPVGTNCGNSNCIPGVNAPVGTNCSTTVTCTSGVTVLVGTVCPTTTLSSTGLGCTPGVAPCGPNQTCTPITASQVSCTTAAPASTTTIVPPATTAATASQPPANVQIVNPPSTGVTGQAVSFSAATAIAQNAGASISSYTWSFGDGGAGSGQTVSHTYATPGAYSVGLTVSTSAGTTANASTSITVAAAAPPGMSIVVAAGWNLIGGPNATIVSGNGGSLYTYQAGDGAYEVIPNGAPLKAGEGYWVYFPTAGTTTIPLVSAQPTSIQAPAGQFIMIGNPTDGNVKVSGADIVFAYSASGSYQQTTTIAAGMGAWAYSAHGGAVTLTPSP